MPVMGTKYETFKSTNAGGPLDVWAQNWLGQRFRVTFTDGEMDWGRFVTVVNGEVEWLSDRADSNGVSYLLGADQIESVVPVSEMDPPGQDALFDKQPYDLTVEAHAQTL